MSHSKGVQWRYANTPNEVLAVALVQSQRDPCIVESIVVGEHALRLGVDRKNPAIDLRDPKDVKN